MRLSLVAGGLAAAMLIAGLAFQPRPAYAVKEFRAEFAARYAKPNSRKPADKAFAKVIDKAQCTICHPGDDKHKLTAYGAAVAQLVNQHDKGSKARIQAAFDAVARRRSDPFDPNAPTFGELLDAGKLPRAPFEANENNP